VRVEEYGIEGGVIGALAEGCPPFLLNVSTRNLAELLGVTEYGQIVRLINLDSAGDEVWRGGVHGRSDSSGRACGLWAVVVDLVPRVGDAECGHLYWRWLMGVAVQHANE